jgi:hypothetical protein
MIAFGTVKMLDKIQTDAISTAMFLDLSASGALRGWTTAMYLRLILKTFVVEASYFHICPPLYADR